MRVDAALEAGQEVGTFYDPMLAKLVASGTSREAARLNMVDALDNTAVLGLTTNLGFLRRLVASEPFRERPSIRVRLDQRIPELPPPDTRIPLAAAALFVVESARRRGENDPFAGVGRSVPWRSTRPDAAWRSSPPGTATRWSWRRTRAPEKGPSKWTGAATCRSTWAQLEPGELTAEVDGRRERFTLLAKTPSGAREPPR